MAKKINIEYEEIDDILYLGKGERSKFSVDVALPSGDVIIDIGFDGYVKGIEIINASDFFSLKKDELKRIKNAQFNILYGPSYISITIILEHPTTKQLVKNNLVIPYNKKLALAA